MSQEQTDKGVIGDTSQRENLKAENQPYSNVASSATAAEHADKRVTPHSDKRCHQCGELGHIARNCKAKQGRKRGTRSREADAAVAKGAREDIQKVQGEVDAKNAVIRDLAEQIKEMNEKPGKYELPAPRKLQSLRPFDVETFQTMPTIMVGRDGVFWAVLVLVVSLVILVQEVFLEWDVNPLVYVPAYAAIAAKWWLDEQVPVFQKGTRLYRRIGIIAPPDADSDVRGPFNRAQDMVYNDTHIAIWEVTEVSKQCPTHTHPEERLLCSKVVNETLVQLLLQPNHTLLARTPELVRSKMELTARNQSFVNVPYDLQAKHNIAGVSVELAMAYLYGYKYASSRTCVGHNMVEPTKVLLPAMY
jgi:hypothetical protein